MRLCASLPALMAFLALMAGPARAQIRLTEPFGAIESPELPQPYPDYANMTWMISADPGYQVVLYFSIFDLEDSFDPEMGGYCVYDYVKIEGAGRTPRLCGHGPSEWRRFRSEDTTMTLTFFSDYSNEVPRPIGFRAHYYIDDKDECQELKNLVQSATDDWDQVIYCNHFCINVPGSYYCACRAGFVLDANQHTCVAVCSGNQLTADSGKITSPDYPAPYSKLTDCDWSIEVRNGLSLYFVFSSPFEIEDHYNYTECVYDWLKVSYGGVERTYCGSEVPNGGREIYTNGRSARFVFHTDYAVEKRGFEITYNTTRMRCNHHPPAPNGGSIVNSILEAEHRDYYVFEDEILFACDTGYTLVGANRILCQDDGTWNGQPPRCQIKSCGDPLQLRVANSKLNAGASFTYNSNVTVTCNKWYELVSGTTAWICNEHKQWVPSGNRENILPKCDPVCGKKNVASFLRALIGNGEAALPHEWPWMVFINFGNRGNVAARRAVCGGSLVDANFVLTAAHCILKQDNSLRNPTKIFVWLGVHNRENDAQGRTVARMVRVTEVFRHPGHNSTTQDNDVAVLRLANEVVMDDNVRPICLPSNQRPPDFTTGYVAGWGMSDEETVGSNVLLDASMTIIPSQTCDANFKRLASANNRILEPWISVKANMFCTDSGESSNTHTCQGDSGGPFMIKDTDTNKYSVYGIVSWGLSLDLDTERASTTCGSSQANSVFTRLTPKIVAWIVNVTRND